MFSIPEFFFLFYWIPDQVRDDRTLQAAGYKPKASQIEAEVLDEIHWAIA